jgi:peptidoglycan/xylan/chitin deacetylase (PgdA/CDA1 family)
MHIICLHNIVDGKPDKFDKKCSRISLSELEKFISHCESKGFYFCSFSTSWEKRNDPKALALSFDDGFLGVYKYAYPLLEKKNITPAIFLNPEPLNSSKNIFHFLEIEMLFRLREDLVDKDLDIVKFMKDTKKKLKKCHPEERIKLRDQLLKTYQIELNEIYQALEKEEKYQLMSWEQIKELRDHKWVIGAHTLNHPPLAFLSKDEKDYEISESKNQLENKLGMKIDYFAYPYGDSFAFDEVDQTIVRNLFKFGFSTIEEEIDEERPWSIPRYDYKKFKELVGFSL